MNSKRFGFVLLPEFALLPLSCMVDTLEDANYVSERRLYDWCSLSVEGAEVAAANGLRLTTDCVIRDAPPLDSVVVCSAFDAHLHRSPRLNRWLNRQFESGARVGAIATGSWQLACAGLLEGRRCTIQWEDLPSFRETFPILDVSDAIFEIATACGFSSASYLARCHRRRFGRSPRVERAHAAIRRIPSHVPGAAR